MELTAGRALDKLIVQYPQDVATAYNPQPFGERVGYLLHPAE